MQKTLGASKNKPTFEINWKIRELFSEAALANFYDEIDNKYLLIKNNQDQLILSYLFKTFKSIINLCQKNKF